MDKLIIPGNCIIDGHIDSLENIGDIQIENGLVPNKLKSEKGSIRVTNIGADNRCDNFLAPNGDIDLEGKSLRLSQTVSKTITLQLDSLHGQTIQATEGTTYFSGTTLQLEQLKADNVEIEAKSVQIGLLHVNGNISIKADEIRIEELEGDRVTISGRFESNKVIGRKGLVVEKGHVAIKNLDAPSFTSGEGVTGIVMVATCEHVQTQGVRGFLRPAELGMFSSGNSTMDLAEILGISGATASRPFGNEHSLSKPAKASADVSEKTSTPTTAAPSEPNIQTQSPTPSPAEPPTFSMDDDEEALESAMDFSENNASFSIEEPSEEPSFKAETFASEDQFEEMDSLTSMEMEEIEDDEDVEDGEDDENHRYGLKTTVVMDSLEDDQGEMKTIQLNPSDLQNAIHATNSRHPFFTPADPAEALNEVEMQDPEINDILAEEISPESVDLPEIEGFEDYQNTGELNDELDKLDGSAPEDPLSGIDMPSEADDLWVEDVHSEDLGDDIEVEELSEDDLYSVDETGFTDANVQVQEQPSAEPETEDNLKQALTRVLNQIREFFPDENYPKFIYQIQNYVNEERFSILAKTRNREAVLSSFEKLNHPEISQLADTFYATLASYYQDDSF